MTRFSHPPTVFGVGRWPRGRFDVTGVRRWHGDPPQTSFLGARPHGAPCSYLGNQGDINHFSQHFSQPLFTHPQDRCRKGHKDPIPRWLCSGSCTQGNFLKGWSPPLYLPLIARPIASCSPPPSLQKELPAARRMGIPPSSCPPSPGSHQPLFQALGALSHPSALFR